MKYVRRSSFILAFLALAVVAGILGAQWYDRVRLQRTVEPALEGKQTIIAEIVLAALADPATRDQENPPLQQHPTYTTQDLLALRITTQAGVTSPVQMGARLLTEAGTVVELDPPSMTLPPGQSTFCCWQVEAAGTYTLQLFRPEGIITTIPLTIRPALTQPRANIKLGI